MIILIPAYEPGPRFLDVIDSINEQLNFPEIVVVDDGSGPLYREVFDGARSRGAEVLSYEKNRGKGLALKHGITFIQRSFPNESIVCADCDGQHTAHDIGRVARALEDGSSDMVLGARAFTGAVPLRSRLGNSVTRLAFAAATRTKISDTQTGLRGYRPGILDWLRNIGGERFEYEFNVLLAAHHAGVSVTEIPIETVYLEQNASSHFRPLADSARIYWPLAKFTFSSFGAFIVDFVCLLTFMSITGNLLVSVVAARVVSATANFLANRQFVFSGAKQSPNGAASRYATLVVALLGANYVLLRILTSMSLSLATAKVITEMTLFIASYQVQKRLVFKKLDAAGWNTDRTSVDAA